MIAANGAGPTNVPTTASFGGGSSINGASTLGGTAPVGAAPVSGIAPTRSAPRPVLDSRQPFAGQQVDGARYGTSVVRATPAPSSRPPAPPGPLHAHG
jgi:hypothetical protein